MLLEQLCGLRENGCLKMEAILKKSISSVYLQNWCKFYRIGVIFLKTVQTVPGLMYNLRTTHRYELIAYY